MPQKRPRPFRGFSFGQMLILYASALGSMLAGAQVVHSIYKPDLVSQVHVGIF